jgi:tetratricopeptide (TPR) repeat protein
MDDEEAPMTKTCSKRHVIPAITLAAAAILMIVLAAGPGCRPSSSGAVIAESSESIRTYPFSDPDPVPIFARSSMWGQGARLYPYFIFDRFTAEPVDKPWTVVRLKNASIEVAVLPGAGGKVWGARENATGRDFIYWNRVLKFRQIALRGPWTSGGIEWNFGVVGHAPSTATPVDYVLRRNPDGSASCVVGTMDLASRTRWSVTITLPKDGAVFETSAHWVNPTPFSQSYYAWSCAAVKAAEDLKYIFPGQWFIGHDYSVPLEPWPVDRSGRDLSWYRNNATPGSKSYFTVGKYDDFYGGWYEKSDAGFGHWSPYEDMPGRKVWIWDLSRSGEIWVDLLTDKDGQYTEPQAGRLLNQSDHGDFPPGAADRWRELWFPYSGIGPMTKASPDAALRVSRTAEALDLGLFALRPIADDLTVRAAGREIFKERLVLVPEQVWKKPVPLAGVAADAPLEVRLGAKLVFETAPDADSLERPLHFSTPTGSSAEALFLQGRSLERERRLPEALDRYLAAIAEEPLHVRALTRAAELYTRRGETGRGLEYAGRALAVSMYDPEANYVYAVAARRMGRFVDAKETLGWAARSPQFKAVALVQSAEIALVEKDFARALETARRALAADAANVNALEILAVAERLDDRIAEARNTLDRLEELDPLDHLGRFERYLLSRKPADLEACRALIRSELPHETWLEIAAFYARLGLVSDAVEALEPAPAQATVLYTLAYLLRERAPAESSAYLDQASAASPFLVFPFREEEIPVFSWALAARPSDWKPKYYLSLILWGKGRIDEARDLFEMIESADFAPFYIARASFFERTDPVRAAGDYRKAVELDGSSWRARHTLTAFLLRQGQEDEALGSARKAAADFPAEMPLQVDLAETLLAAGDPHEAARVLDAVAALPYEGASNIHGLYVQAHIGIGLEAVTKGAWADAIRAFELSKLYPEKLGTGAPFRPDSRMQDYFIAVCLDRLGEKDKAAALREAVREYTLTYWDEGQPYGYFGGLVLEKLGRKDDRLKARELLGLPKPPADVMAVVSSLR